MPQGSAAAGGKAKTFDEKAYMHAYWKKNKAKLQEYNAKYYVQHTEDMKASARERTKDWSAEDWKAEYQRIKAAESNWTPERKEAKRVKVAAEATARYRANPSFYIAQGKKNAQANPDRYKKIIRKHLLKKHYGLTLEQFDDMAAKQGYACLICSMIPTKTLHIDHDHKTGAIRGLLCSNCNTALGLLKDNPDFLLQAIKYLN